MEIKVNLKERGYSIFVGNKNITALPGLLDKLRINPKLAIVSTPPVSTIYLKSISGLLASDWQVHTYDVPDGESSKSGTMVEHLYTWLIENHFERTATVMALGGGVIGDLAGFVASTYLRGINLIQIPTTLLAQVDSSIGGKVGINHQLGKNLIGAFYQPKMVLADISFLKTLPDEEFVCGMGEIVKYGILGDGRLFAQLEENFESIMRQDSSILEEVVFTCARMKARIVEKDEQEQGIRAYLNLGHTFAHALETYFSYAGMKHGQAVLLGMKCALYVSRHYNLITKSLAERMENLINRFNVRIPTAKSLDTDELVSIMKRDKKMRKGVVNLVLPADFGNMIVKPVSDEHLLADSFQVIQ